MRVCNPNNRIIMSSIFFNRLSDSHNTYISGMLVKRRGIRVFLLRELLFSMHTTRIQTFRWLANTLKQIFFSVPYLPEQSRDHLETLVFNWGSSREIRMNIFSIFPNVIMRFVFKCRFRRIKKEMCTYSYTEISTRG